MLTASAQLGDLSQYPDLRQYNDLPRDVRVFIDRRAGCDHFAGEEAYDKERAKELDKAFRDLKCGRLDRDERNLRRRYAKSPRILKALKETQDVIW